MANQHSGGKVSSEDVHRMLFGALQPKARPTAEFDAGVRRYLRAKHAPAKLTGTKKP